jgi:hypothetical protein
MIITSIKCNKKFGPAIKLNVQGTQRIDWTEFNPSDTRSFSVRVPLPITPASITMNLFDRGVSETLSAASQLVSTGAGSPDSKIFSYRSNRGNYVVSYRIETTVRMDAIAEPVAIPAA